jgi:hypothetical protein
MTAYGLTNRGSISEKGSDFHLLTQSRPTLAPIQWVSAALFHGVNRPVRDADHSPPYKKGYPHGFNNIMSKRHITQYFVLRHSQTPSFKPINRMFHREAEIL